MSPYGVIRPQWFKIYNIYKLRMSVIGPDIIIFPLLNKYRNLYEGNKVYKYTNEQTNEFSNCTIESCIYTMI